MLNWAETNHLRRLLVVTSAFHTGRASVTYQRAARGRTVTVRMRATRASGYRPDSWWHSRVELRNAVIEWQKLVVYRLW